jgi:5-methylcytosine-specific restriction endonuclease McrA
VELDPESRRFQQEVDELVRRWARGDDKEYWRRWKQLGSWSINRTQGDVVKKAALKKILVAKTGGKCTDCGNVFEPAALQMHRLDPSLAHDRTLNFGYVESNVVLLCAGCHEGREAARR